MIYIGINGFGRIARILIRQILNDKNLKLVAINYYNINLYDMRYLLIHDTNYSKLNVNIKIDKINNHIIIDNNIIEIYNNKDIRNIKWNKKINSVIDTTGKYKTIDTLKFHKVENIILSCPPKDNDIPMFIYSVNHDLYKKQNIISSSSCTTNCLSPAIFILNKYFNINKCFCTSIHSVTNSQSILDSRNVSDVRRGRSCMQNIIPTTTGANKSITKIIPEMEDKIVCTSIRVPITLGSLIDMSVSFNEKTSIKEITEKFEKLSQIDQKFYNVINVLKYPIVSSDIIGNKYVCNFDPFSSVKLDEKNFKLSFWYDNEFSYSYNLLNLLKYINMFESFLITKYLIIK